MGQEDSGGLSGSLEGQREEHEAHAYCIYCILRAWMSWARQPWGTFEGRALSQIWGTVAWEARGLRDGCIQDPCPAWEPQQL